MHIREALEIAIESNEERTALKRHEGDELTYSELLERGRRIASGLESLGIEQGDMVAFSGPNTLDSLSLIFSNWYSGRTTVHVNPKLDADELPYYLEDSNADALVYHSSIREKVEKTRKDFDGVMVQMEGEAPHWAHHFEELRESEPLEEEVEDEDYISNVGYTSGTTGLPKGVPHMNRRRLHTAMILNWEKKAREGGIDALQEEVRKRREGSKSRTEPLPEGLLEEAVRESPVADDTSCLIFPVYHMAGTSHVLAALLGGSEIVLPEDREAGKTLEAIDEHGITTMGGVQAQFKSMAEHPDLHEFDTSSLRHLHINALTSEAAETIQENLCENICTEYASNEAGEVSFAIDRPESIGRPTFLQRVRLVEQGSRDPENTVEQGETGEVIVDSDSILVFDGYLGRPEETEEAFEDGWYFTGDLARFDERDELRFEGRVANMIKSGGENIAPPEVEEAIVSHPDVDEAGVIGAEDETWGERVVAFVSGGSVDVDELDRYLRESELADFKRPKEYRVRDQLPMIETGGVDRKKLEDIYRDDA